MAYVFTEHSPSTTTYIRSGRGGAGNTFRTADLPAPPPSGSLLRTSTSHVRVPTSSSFSPSATTTSSGRRFFSGIGGAGNVHEADHARAPALLRSLESSGAPGLGLDERSPAVGYVGRGGAGNVYRAAGRAGSDAGSVASEASGASGRSWASDGSTLSAKAKAWATRVVSNF